MVLWVHKVLGVPGVLRVLGVLRFLRVLWRFPRRSNCSFQIALQTRIRFDRPKAQPSPALVILFRLIAALETVEQMILRFMKRTGGNRQEMLELLRSIPSEPFRGIPRR